jgi:hypothetical protein
MTEALGTKTKQRKLTQKSAMWDERGMLEHSHLLRMCFGQDGTYVSAIFSL